jgi:hypothetical protein
MMADHALMLDIQALSNPCFGSEGRNWGAGCPEFEHTKSAINDGWNVRRFVKTGA